VLVSRDDDRLALPLRHRHRHDLVVEQPALDRRDGTLVRPERERVLALRVTSRISP
jgi:hypothetical protein